MNDYGISEARLEEYINILRTEGPLAFLKKVGNERFLWPAPVNSDRENKFLDLLETVILGPDILGSYLSTTTELDLLASILGQFIYFYESTTSRSTCTSQISPEYKIEPSKFVVYNLKTSEIKNYSKNIPGRVTVEFSDDEYPVGSAFMYKRTAFVVIDEGKAVSIDPAIMTRDLGAIQAEVDSYWG